MLFPVPVSTRVSDQRVHFSPRLHSWRTCPLESFGSSENSQISLLAIFFFIEESFFPGRKAFLVSSRLKTAKAGHSLVLLAYFVLGTRRGQFEVGFVPFHNRVSCQVGSTRDSLESSGIVQIQVLVFVGPIRTAQLHTWLPLSLRGAGIMLVEYSSRFVLENFIG